MTSNETEPLEGTREQLETLARWMGWEPYRRGEADLLPKGYVVFSLAMTAVEFSGMDANLRSGTPSWTPTTTIGCSNGHVRCGKIQ